MYTIQPLDIAVSVLALVSLAYIRSRRSLPLPPGPKGWPLIGSLLEMPTAQPWKVYQQWGERYGMGFLMGFLPCLSFPSDAHLGGILSFTVLGQRFVVVNDRKLMSLRTSLGSIRIFSRDRHCYPRQEGHSLC
jgi:hypothetical protein